MPDIKLLARLALPLQPLFARLEPSLASIYRQLSQPPAPNLWGDRDIEHYWVAAYVPDGPGEGLDFGSGDSHLSLVAARRGFRMLASDLNPVQSAFQHPAVRFVQADALALPPPPQSFDLILNCSTIEHLGLGRYGDRVDPDADLKGMSRLHDLLKPTGIMLLTPRLESIRCILRYIASMDMPDFRDFWATLVSHGTNTGQRRATMCGRWLTRPRHSPGSQQSTHTPSAALLSKLLRE